MFQKVCKSGIVTFLQLNSENKIDKNNIKNLHSHMIVYNPRTLKQISLVSPTITTQDKSISFIMIQNCCIYIKSWTWMKVLMNNISLSTLPHELMVTGLKAVHWLTPKCTEFKQTELSANMIGNYVCICFLAVLTSIHSLSI